MYFHSVLNNNLKYLREQDVTKYLQMITYNYSFK